MKSKLLEIVKPVFEKRQPARIWKSESRGSPKSFVWFNAEVLTHLLPVLTNAFEFSCVRSLGFIALFAAAARLHSGKNKPCLIVFYEAEQQQQHLAKQIDGRT